MKGFRKQPKPTNATLNDQAKTLEAEVRKNAALVNILQTTLQQCIQQMSNNSKEIEAMSKLLTSKELKDDEVAEDGDRLVIDFAGRLVDEDGNESNYNGISGMGFMVEIGSKTTVEGFEDYFVGKKVGHTGRTPRFTFPKEYGNKDLAGREIFFDVEILKAMRPLKGTHAVKLIKQYEQEEFDKQKALLEETKKAEEQQEDAKVLEMNTNESVSSNEQQQTT